MPLTARQQQVLAVIQDSLRRHGYPPSIRELAQRLHVSIGTIQDHLRALERKGVLQRRPFQARGLSLSAAREQATGGAVQEIPIVGRVTAGAPVLVEEAIDGVIPVAIAWAKGEDLFFLRVQGEGMVPTLHDGDYLLVRRQESVEHGTIAVALIEGEVTVKRVVPGGHDLILTPDNEAFPVLRVNVRQQTLRILGKAVGLYRKL
jgi:repressor LexA